MNTQAAQVCMDRRHKAGDDDVGEGGHAFSRDNSLN
jgi:hypothetical protein